MLSIVLREKVTGAQSRCDILTKWNENEKVLAYILLFSIIKKVFQHIAVPVKSQQQGTTHLKK